MSRRFLSVVLCAASLIVVATAQAQILLTPKGSTAPQGEATPKAPTPPRPVRPQAPAGNASGRENVKTIIDVDIIIPPVGAGAEVQEWGRFFQSIGISAQLRQGLIGEKPATTESTRGTIRTVTVVGRLDPRGKVLFFDRTYTPADREKVKEWIEELKTYGAQGSPEGKPTWGLNKEQFEALFESLSKPTVETYKGRRLDEMLAGGDWKGEGQYPLRLHTATETVLSALTTEHTIRIDPVGLSRGTALAILLEDAGLGFRPQRTPSGTIELTIYPLSAIKDPWPMGWPPDPVQPRNEIAPGYFKNGQVDFEGQPLDIVLAACAERAETPILIDYPKCEAKKVRPAEVLVSHPPRKLAYALVVNTVVHQARLTAPLKLDEAGKAFVHVMPFEPRIAAP